MKNIKWLRLFLIFLDFLNNWISDEEQHFFWVQPISEELPDILLPGLNIAGNFKWKEAVLFCFFRLVK